MGMRAALPAIPHAGRGRFRHGEREAAYLAAPSREPVRNVVALKDGLEKDDLAVVIRLFSYMPRCPDLR